MDFANCTDVNDFLCILYSTFCEFRSHEYIENTIIMKELKIRLEAQSIYNRAVCKCHEDNRLSEVLDLVKDGYMCMGKSVDECVNYGRKLQQALQDFTGTFLPHMQEEEEIFQPLLMKYFEYEELKLLKELVIKEHELWKEKISGKEKDLIENEKETIESDHENISESENVTEVGKEAAVSDGQCKEIIKSDFNKLPEEVALKIFKYLSVPERGICAQVCQSWNKMMYSPTLWMELYPAQWAQGIWNFSTYDMLPLLEAEAEKGIQCGNCSFFDDDGDFDESDEACDDCNGEVSLKAKLINEVKMLNNIVDFLLPKVGRAVRKLVLFGSRGLKSHHLKLMLEMCPNLEHLDASYTFVTDGAFKGLAGRLPYLKVLDLSGCSRLTDLALERLATCCVNHSCNLHTCEQIKNPCSNQEQNVNHHNCVVDMEQCHGCRQKQSSGLHYLSLSGCSAVSDKGVQALVGTSGFLEHLSHLDLSGCYKLSRDALHGIIRNCPKLQPQNLYYCSLIAHGPFEKEANGCQNLQCPIRICCCLGD